MGVPANIRYPWSEIEPLLDEAESVDGVRTFRYGGGEVLPTLAVTAFSVEAGATLELPAQTGGAVILCADGRFEGEGAAMDRLDVLALRAWTPTALRCASVDGGLLMTVDTSPALRRLGLQRRAVR